MITRAHSLEGSCLTIVIPCSIRSNLRQLLNATTPQISLFPGLVAFFSSSPLCVYLIQNSTAIPLNSTLQVVDLNSNSTHMYILWNVFFSGDLLQSCKFFNSEKKVCSLCWEGVYGCHPNHIFLRVSTNEQNGAYLWVDMLRIALFGSFSI